MKYLLISLIFFSIKTYANEIKNFSGAYYGNCVTQYCEVESLLKVTENKLFIKYRDYSPGGRYSFTWRNRVLNIEDGRLVDAKKRDRGFINQDEIFLKELTCIGFCDDDPRPRFFSLKRNDDHFSYVEHFLFFGSFFKVNAEAVNAFISENEEIPDFSNFNIGLVGKCKMNDGDKCEAQVLVRVTDDEVILLPREIKVVDSIVYTFQKKIFQRIGEDLINENGVKKGYLKENELYIEESGCFGECGNIKKKPYIRISKKGGKYYFEQAYIAYKYYRKAYGTLSNWFTSN